MSPERESPTLSEGELSTRPEDWARAGGDLERLAIYASIGKAKVFSSGASRVLATIHPERPQTGALGDWVGELGVLHAAEAWLASQGCEVAVGPMELCRWFDYRATLGPFDEPPFTFEPTTPAGRWIEAGYEEVQRFVSLVADRDALIRASLDRAAALSARGYTLVPLAEDQAPSAIFAEHLETVHRLFSQAFAQVDGFLPIPPDALWRFYRGRDEAIDPRLIRMALDPDGDPVGLVVAVPDQAQPERGWYLVMSLAVRPSHRHLGVGTWLLGAVHQAGRKAGYQAGIHSFVRLHGADDSKIYAGRVFRRYALFEKTLEPPAR